MEISLFCYKNKNPAAMAGLSSMQEGPPEDLAQGLEGLATGALQMKAE